MNLEGDEAKTLTQRMSSDKKYVVLAHGLDRETADQVRAAAAAKNVEAVLLESEPLRVYPHDGGGPDSTLAAQLLGFVNRDGIGQYGVEQYYQDLLAGRPRIVHSAARRGGSRHSGHDRRRGPGSAWRGPEADDRRRAPAGPRAGGPGRLGGRQGQERFGCRHGPIHRRGARAGHVSLVRRQRLPDGRSNRSVTLHRPDRQFRVRARVGLQDADRHRRAGNGDGHDEDEDQGRRDAQARRRPDPCRRCRPQGQRDDDVRGRGRLVAQRRRGEGRPRPRRYDRRVVGDPARHVVADGVRPEDGNRCLRRGPRPRQRSDDLRLAPDRPCERGVRAGHRGHADPARRIVFRDGQRRDAGPAARGQGNRDDRCRAPVAGTRDRRSACPRPLPR